MPRFRDQYGPLDPPELTAPQSVRQGRVDYVPHQTIDDLMMRDAEGRRLLEWQKRHEARMVPRRLKFISAVLNLQRHAGNTRELLPGLLSGVDDIVVDGQEPQPTLNPLRRLRRPQRRRA